MKSTIVLERKGDEATVRKLDKQERLAALERDTAARRTDDCYDYARCDRSECQRN